MTLLRGGPDARNTGKSALGLKQRQCGLLRLYLKSDSSPGRLWRRRPLLSQHLPRERQLPRRWKQQRCASPHVSCT